ncbi:MAG: protein kinase domain-containing protein [Ktedonobacterales bacterium]
MQTIEGTWREDGQMPAPPVTDDRPAWLKQAMQETGQTVPSDTSAPNAPSSTSPHVNPAIQGGIRSLPPSQDGRPSQQTPSMPRGFAGPPTLRPAGSDGQGPANPSSYPRQSSGNLGQMPLDPQHNTMENRWSNPSQTPNTQGVPSRPSSMPDQFGQQYPPAPSGPFAAGGPSWGAPNQPAYPSNPNAGYVGSGQSGPNMPNTPYGSAVPPTMSSMPSMGVTPFQGRELQPVADQPAMLVQALGPGTLLKSGRYRLVQRFNPLALAYAQHDEPPLMIASDTELGGGRVLVQELLLNSVRPENTDNTRRLIAQRVQELALTGSVPRLLDHFGERRRHFLVFEMPDGDTLAERLQRAHGPLEETVALNFALKTLDALASFERQRPAFIHGNICPANIVVRPGGQVILVGCSPMLLLHPDGHVEHGAAGGILGYAAPEQIRGQASMRSDLFSLCATLHHAVTGVAPASRTNVILAPARHVNPNISLELEEALSHGLRPSPTQRYQSASELRQALQPLASGRVTHVPKDMLEDSATPVLAPVRDARGRLVLPRRRASQNPLMLAAIIIMLIVLVGGGTLLTLSLRSGSGADATPTATPNELVNLFQTQGIALSGGEFIFDSNRQDNALKQQGARAIAAGDLATAEIDFQSALTNDPSDAEAAIYIQDVQILRRKQAYVTVVAAVAFGQDDMAARAELQGVYLAQERINRYRILPGNLLLRVQVLNSGASVDGATAAANVLLTQIQRGNAQHLIGIIGWPASEQTAVAISVLKPSGLALVSPTATADNLGGTAANFFALMPSDSIQDAELADAAVTQLNAQQIMVLSDPQSPASAASATAFTKRITDRYAATVRLDQVRFTTNMTTGFDAIAQRGLYQGDQLIFLAGSDQDAARLSQAVTKINQAAGASVHVLADHRVLTPALLGVGDSPAAGLVRGRPDALSALLVANLADAKAWLRIQGGTQSELATFGVDYQVAFGALAEPSGLQEPDATTILSYDATRLLAAADVNIAQAKGNTTSPDPTLIRAQILQYGQSHPFFGVCGAVIFSSAGRVTEKALALDALRPLGGGTPGKAVVQLVLDRIIGGQEMFCAMTDCSRAA